MESIISVLCSVKNYSYYKSATQFKVRRLENETNLQEQTSLLVVERTAVEPIRSDVVGRSVLISVGKMKDLLI